MICLFFQQTNYQPTQSDAKNVSDEVVDVESTIWQQVLDRLGGDRHKRRHKPNRKAQTGAAAHEEGKVHKEERARDIDRGME